MHSHRQARRAHRSQAASLKAVTRIILNNTNLNHLIKTQLDVENSPPPDSEDASWFDTFDLDQ
jgi:hypothetical protein